MKRISIIGNWCFLLILPLLTTCNARKDFEDLKDSVSVYMSMPELNTHILITAVDAASYEPITKEIYYEFVGENSENLYDMVGERITSGPMYGGFASASLGPNIVPDENNVISLTVEINAEGFISNSQTIEINQEGITEIVVPLVNVNNPPKGVYILQKIEIGTSNSHGEVIASSNLEIAPNEAFVSLPMGTKLLDENYNPIAGTILADIAFYSPTENTSLSVFPGGFSPKVVLADGSESEGAFFSAGLFTINMYSGEKEIKYFEDGGVQISSFLNDSLFNPTTGEALKVGDNIDLWSYHEEMKVWNHESVGKVVEEVGKLKIEAELPHLSSWNWDWYGPTCWNGIRIGVNMLNATQPFRVNVTLDVDDAVSRNYSYVSWFWNSRLRRFQSYYSSATNSTRDVQRYKSFFFDPIRRPYNNYIKMYGMPSQIKGVKITLDSNGSSVPTSISNSTFSLNTLCGVTKNISVSQGNSTETQIFNAQINLYCEGNRNRMYWPFSFLQVQKVSESSWTYRKNYFISYGKVRGIAMDANEEYSFKMYYRGEYYGALVKYFLEGNQIVVKYRVGKLGSYNGWTYVQNSDVGEEQVKILPKSANGINDISFSLGLSNSNCFSY